MEITIVDKKDNVIGSMSIKDAIEKGEIRRISRILVLNKNKIFLQRRSKDMPIYPDTWDSSAAGHVDKGETYIEAAHRELFEEIGVKGVKLKETAYFYLDEIINGHHAPCFNKIFECDYSGEFEIGEEVSYGKWFDMKELKEMIKTNPSEFSPAFIAALDHR